MMFEMSYKMILMTKSIFNEMECISVNNMLFRKKMLRKCKKRNYYKEK